MAVNIQEIVSQMVKKAAEIPVTLQGNPATTMPPSSPQAQMDAQAAPAGTPPVDAKIKQTQLVSDVMKNCLKLQKLNQKTDDTIAQFGTSSKKTAKVIRRTIAGSLNAMAFSSDPDMLLKVASQSRGLGTGVLPQLVHSAICRPAEAAGFMLVDTTSHDEAINVPYKCASAEQYNEMLHEGIAAKKLASQLLESTEAVYAGKSQDDIMVDLVVKSASLIDAISPETWGVLREHVKQAKEDVKEADNYKSIAFDDTGEQEIESKEGAEKAIARLLKVIEQEVGDMGGLESISPSIKAIRIIITKHPESGEAEQADAMTKAAALKAFEGDNVNAAKCVLGAAILGKLGTPASNMVDDIIGLKLSI